MINRKKPGVAFWAIAALSMPALYLLSFGPACWLVNRKRADCLTVARIYRPLVGAADSDSSLSNALRWYGDLDRPRNRDETVIPMVCWMNFALSLYDEGHLK